MTSSNRSPGSCEAVLHRSNRVSSAEIGPISPAAIGPVRLPVKEPKAFVEEFNRIYQGTGLSIVPLDNSPVVKES